MKSSKQADDRQNEQMDVVALIEVINAGGEMRDLQSFHAILTSYRGIYIKKLSQTFPVLQSIRAPTHCQETLMTSKCLSLISLKFDRKSTFRILKASWLNQ